MRGGKGREEETVKREIEEGKRQAEREKGNSKSKVLCFVHLTSFILR